MVGASVAIPCELELEVAGISVGDSVIIASDMSKRTLSMLISKGPTQPLHQSSPKPDIKLN
jgi:hypothetical protein